LASPAADARVDWTHLRERRPLRAAFHDRTSSPQSGQTAGSLRRKDRNAARRLIGCSTEPASRAAIKWAAATFSSRPIAPSMKYQSTSESSGSGRLGFWQDVRVSRKARRANISFSVPGYSITSSAVASNLSGAVRPIVLAAWALMTSSNLLACTIGRSAGFAPLRMRPA
jgi:hypothetical protein